MTNSTIEDLIVGAIAIITVVGLLTTNPQKKESAKLPPVEEQCISGFIHSWNTTTNEIFQIVDEKGAGIPCT